MTVRDCIERIGDTVFQHGPYNDRIYVMTTTRGDLPRVLPYLDTLATEQRYGKIIAKCPAACVEDFEVWGARCEGRVPDYYGRDDDACFMARYQDPDRAVEPFADVVAANLALARSKAGEPPSRPGEVWDGEAEQVVPADVETMGDVYRTVFPTYPFPIDDPAYLRHAMQNDVVFFKLTRGGRIGALASAEMDVENAAVEMTDFATLPEFRGQGAAQGLLQTMEAAMRARGMRTAFNIARAYSAGMNVTFAKCGYAYGCTLTGNTNIAGRTESMNIWSKAL